MKHFICVMAMALTSLCNLGAAEQKSLNDDQFQEKLRGVQEERDTFSKRRHARELLGIHRFSSLQVKAIALTLPDDDSRLEFATMAYPRTIDPENFYEVYDAFTKFSKVMRLHDRIRPMERPAPAPVRLPRLISDNDLKDIIKSLRRETFDNTRGQVARTILASSRAQFLSAQVKQMVQCFDFEPNKLEFAKFAYEYTFDKEKYFLVNEAFDFDNNKQALARHIESWNKQHPPQAEAP